MIGIESIIVVDNVTIFLEKYHIVSLKIDENQNQRKCCAPPPLWNISKIIIYVCT